MWNRMTIVVVGHPVMVRSNWPVAAVIFPVVSLVVFSVNVPLPEQAASASLMIGTSFVVLRSAVKTYFRCGVGAGAGVGLGVGAGEAVTTFPPPAARALAASGWPAVSRQNNPAL